MSNPTNFTFYMFNPERERGVLELSYIETFTYLGLVYIVHGPLYSLPVGFELKAHVY